MPKNVNALAYVAPTGQGAGNGTTFRLLGPAGAEVATTSVPDPWWAGGSLLLPENAVAEGTGWRIAYLESCTAMGSDADGSRRFSFGPSATARTKAGALRADAFEVADKKVTTAAGSCVTTLEALSFDVRLALDVPALAPVTGYEIKVDGQSYRRVYYGAAKMDQGEVIVDRLHAACGARQPYDDTGLTLGRHDISVVAHVAGADVDPPAVTMKVDVSCTDPKMIETDTSNDSDDRADVAPPDLTPPANDAGTTPNGAGASDPTAQATCACDVVGGARAPLSSSFVGAFGLALAWGLRRRRAR